MQYAGSPAAIWQLFLAHQQLFWLTGTCVLAHRQLCWLTGSYLAAVPGSPAAVLAHRQLCSGSPAAMLAHRQLSGSCSWLTARTGARTAARAPEQLLGSQNSCWGARTQQLSAVAGSQLCCAVDKLIFGWCSLPFSSPWTSIIVKNHKALPYQRAFGRF